MLIKRNNISRDDIARLTSDIYKNLISSPIIKGSASVFYMFSPINKEPDMYYIHKRLENIKHNPVICYPLCHPDIKTMDFYEIKDFTEMKPGFKDIMEPDPSKCLRVENENAVMLMPGLAYDIKGNRVGYGGGFYDRYLSTHKVKAKIAVCYDFQDYDDISDYITEHDVKADYIVTDKRLIETK